MQTSAASGYRWPVAVTTCDRDIARHGSWELSCYVIGLCGDGAGIILLPAPS